MEMLVNTLDINQINKLKFVYEIYEGYDIMETGAKVGSIEMIKYAHNYGIDWDETTYRYAAEYGQLVILMYLHENKCPWDEKSCQFASEYGHLETLIYLHENKCPWGRR